MATTEFERGSWTDAATGTQSPGARERNGADDAPLTCR
jgi:hypothetical protein